MKLSWLVFALGLVGFQTSAGVEDLGRRLEKQLKASRIKADEIGTYVGMAHNGKVEAIWTNRDTAQMMPASLTKILTAGAVLEGLGPSKKLETKLLTAGELSDGTLKGDLILQGGGDPGFVSETMWFLVNELTRTGVKRIKGNIIVDDSRFDRVRNDTSRQEERVDRAFDAPVGAMSFNWNSINVYVRPAEKVGSSAKVFLDPENQYVTLQGSVKTGTGSKSKVNVERITTEDGRDAIRVSGEIGKEANEVVVYKNLTQPEIWSGYGLLSFLGQRGIAVEGSVKAGTAPVGARQLARAESKPIATMVTDMMKFSNNFVAEMLTKNLAAEKSGTPAHLADGVGLIKKFLLDQGLSESSFKIVNPSGFSRENRISARDLHSALIHLREHFGVFAEALASFPVAGVDGTLKSRMRGTMAEGRVRAKTGLLNGVVGMAGYAGRPDGTQLSFVFMFNGRPNLGDDARSLFDRLAAELVQ